MNYIQEMLMIYYLFNGIEGSCAVPAQLFGVPLSGLLNFQPINLDEFLYPFEGSI